MPAYYGGQVNAPGSRRRARRNGARRAGAQGCAAPPPRSAADTGIELPSDARRLPARLRRLTNLEIERSISDLLGKPEAWPRRSRPRVRQEGFTPNAAQDVPAAWAVRYSALVRTLAPAAEDFVPSSRPARAVTARRSAAAELASARLPSPADGGRTQAPDLGLRGGPHRRRNPRRARALCARRRVPELPLRDRARRRRRAGRSGDARRVRDRVGPSAYPARSAAGPRAASTRPGAGELRLPSGAPLTRGVCSAWTRRAGSSSASCSSGSRWTTSSGRRKNAALFPDYERLEAAHARRDTRLRRRSHGPRRGLRQRPPRSGFASVDPSMARFYGLATYGPRARLSGSGRVGLLQQASFLARPRPRGRLEPREARRLRPAQADVPEDQRARPRSGSRW